MLLIKMLLLEFVGIDKRSDALNNSRFTNILLITHIFFCWLITVCDGIFFGPKSEYIVAGTYQNISIWAKNSESVIEYMAADFEQVSLSNS